MSRPDDSRTSPVFADNAHRRENSRRRKILAALALGPLTAEQITYRFPGLSCVGISGVLAAMGDEGLIHPLRMRQYPTGPLVYVWHAGPRK
jgi:hypothetical protein